jgi:hypothetical protein
MLDLLNFLSILVQNYDFLSNYRTKNRNNVLFYARFFTRKQIPTLTAAINHKQIKAGI